MNNKASIVNILFIITDIIDNDNKKNKNTWKYVLIGCGVLLIISLCCGLMIGIVYFVNEINNKNNKIKNEEIVPKEEEQKQQEEEKERDRIINEILDKTADLRGLKYNIDDVVMNFITRDELRIRYDQITKEETDEQSQKNNELFFKSLRVIPYDMDLEQVYLDYAGSDVLGFYYPKEGQFYIVKEEGNNITAENKFTISHEFVHYLQDKYFDLEALDNLYDPKIEGNEDVYQAYSALVEGDAMYGSYMYLSTLSKDEYNELMNSSGDSSIESLPRIIKESIMFEYSNGLSFAMGFSNEDRNKIFKKIPSSTEQILHPEKYGVDEPTKLTFSQSFLSELDQKNPGYRRIYTNYCLGELDTKLILQNFDEGNDNLLEEYEEAAAGWDGNATAFWYNDNTGEYIIASKYAFDSTQDLEQFKNAFRSYCNAAGHSFCIFTSDRSDEYVIFEMRGDLTP